MMSRETAEHLNTNILIGFTEKRGNAWHYRADLQTVDPVTGHVGNHYRGPIPIDAVQQRLFNWEAVESPVYVGLPGDEDEVTYTPQFKAIVHPETNQVFKIFSDGYQVHQYSETLIDRTAAILDDGQLAIGSAGLLRGGARAFVSVEVPETVKTKDGVEFRPNLIACTSHDGTLATTWKRHATLVVCDNTMDMALGERGQEYKIRHKKNSLKLMESREALNIIFEDTEEFENELNLLCHKRVTEKQWTKFLDVHIPVPEKDGAPKTIAENKRNEFDDLWRHDERVAPWKGSKFGVLQCANTWQHHLSRVKGGEDMRADKNMEDALSDKITRYDAQTLADLEKAFALA